MSGFSGIQASSLGDLFNRAAQASAGAAAGSGGAGSAGSVGGGGTDGVGKVGEAGAGGFGGLLTEAIGKLNETQQASDTAARDVAAGRTDDLAGALLKIQQADISLQLASSIRNRAIEAYQEIMRMQI